MHGISLFCIRPHSGEKDSWFAAVDWWNVRVGFGISRPEHLEDPAFELFAPSP